MQDPIFRERWLEAVRQVNPAALTGFYSGRFGRIFFGSSYELCFLLWIETLENTFKVERSLDWISYVVDSKERRYNPDFILYTLDGSKNLIEIKSVRFRHFDAEKCLLKSEAARVYCNNNGFKEYLFLSEDHPWADEIGFRRSARIKPLCKRLYKEGKLEIIDKEKERRYIGKVNIRKADSV